MDQYLNAYIERTRPQVAGFPQAAAHELASAFLAFKYGMYKNAIRECTHASTVIPAGALEGVLLKALLILRAHAEYRLNAQKLDNLALMFSPAEQAFAAITIPPAGIEDAGTLALDNALIFVWTVAWIASPEDEGMLEEHRETIVAILQNYKKAMGI